MINSRKRHIPAVGEILIPAVMAAALLLFVSAAGNLNSGHEAEELRRLEDALRRSCVACYAAEGVYPPNIAYLEEHYGLQVDKTRYTVHYDIFAENLMPEITVVKNRP